MARRCRPLAGRLAPAGLPTVAGQRPALPFAPIHPPERILTAPGIFAALQNAIRYRLVLVSNNRLIKVCPPMAKPAHFSTKDRILGAAEELFAQHGFAGTSLRQVTSQADVNIAAVNYHFGSKENLVNEVFRRRMDEMTGARLAQLERARSEHPGQLRPVLAAFVEPALALAQDSHKGGAFVRVVARS
ncbi:hypothetical protein G6F65_018146 [Rhizopus arrhizus]|nr:hypothetical protein G6F65_018146 [Rhizopus arrhizus]